MENSNTIFKFIFIATIIFAFVSPFIENFVVIEVFYLLIPFSIILLVSALIFIINLFKYKSKILKQNSTKLILIIPLFLVLQIASTFLVDNFQRYRSEKIIAELENEKQKYPDSLKTNFGIEYQKIKNSNNYNIKYSRGFFIRQVYSSSDKKWESMGWND